MSRPDERPDGELAARAAAGDERAWRALYDRTCQPLFDFLCWQLGDRDAALDALQETYVAAWRALGGWRGEGTLLSWLRAIALRKSLDWKRAAWRRLRLQARLAREPRAPAAPRDGVVLDAGQAAFRRALARLSPRQRAVLLLHELEELPASEIAATLGCAEPTVRVHLHRARQGLQRALADAPSTSAGMGGQQA